MPLAARPIFYKLALIFLISGTLGKPAAKAAPKPIAKPEPKAAAKPEPKAAAKPIHRIWGIQAGPYFDYGATDYGAPNDYG